MNVVFLHAVGMKSKDQRCEVNMHRMLALIKLCVKKIDTLSACAMTLRFLFPHVTCLIVS